MRRRGAGGKNSTPSPQIRPPPGDGAVGLPAAAGEVCDPTAQPPPLAASLGSGAFVLRRAWPPLRRRPERLAPASYLPLKCHSGMRAGAARPSVTALGHSSASGELSRRVLS